MGIIPDMPLPILVRISSFFLRSLLFFSPVVAHCRTLHGSISWYPCLLVRGPASIFQKFPWASVKCFFHVYSSNTIYCCTHCIIRPILLFRRWEDVSRAIIDVNMWWECVEFSPAHHFRAVQAHALAIGPGYGAESPRRVYIYCCTLRHSSNIIVSQVTGYLEGNNRRKYVVGVCRILATPLLSRASACTCEY